MSGLYLSDTPEGRAVEQVAASLSDGREPGQRATVRKLARVALMAMAELDGAELTASYFAGLSRDALRMRGCGKGRKRG